MRRQRLERPIQVISGVIALFVAWQAVAFCRGDAPYPFPGEFSGLRGSSSLFGQFMYYVTGVGGWMAIAAMVAALGHSCARITAVGWRVFVREERGSWAKEVYIHKGHKQS